MSEEGTVRGSRSERNDGFSRQATSDSRLARLVEEHGLGPSGNVVGQSPNLQP